MRSHPEAFAHLPQDSKRKRRTLGEYLTLAEQLAKETQQATRSRVASDTRLLGP